MRGWPEVHRHYLLYSRVAAVAFALYTIYPVVTKLHEHRLAHDWSHSALHLCSCLIAIYAGWISGSAWPAKLFAVGIGSIYCVLGVAGWYIPGLLLSTPLALPLGPADNIFHLVVGVPALTLVTFDAVRRPHRTGIDALPTSLGPAPTAGGGPAG
jgi:hypothetical protein